MFSATMIDCNKVFCGNRADNLTANTEKELEGKIRQYILEWSWHLNMPFGQTNLTEEQVLTLPLEELQDLLEGDGTYDGYEWVIEEM